MRPAETRIRPFSGRARAGPGRWPPGGGGRRACRTRAACASNRVHRHIKLAGDLQRGKADLHDIGYSPELADTGFHPLDGARYLRDGLRQGSEGEPGPYAATHAATESGELACGTWTHRNAPPFEIDADLSTTTCRFCRAQLGLDETGGSRRLEALFVLSLTLGLRPGELRKLSWDHVDLDKRVIHVWRSASRTGDVKTPKSKRSLVLPSRAVTALVAHRKRQVAERLAAGASWQDNNLVFCHEDRRMYTSDALNWRFSKMTRRAGIGHWHAHEDGTHRGVDHEQHMKKAQRAWPLRRSHLVSHWIMNPEVRKAS
jgi:integrase